MFLLQMIGWDKIMSNQYWFKLPRIMAVQSINVLSRGGYQDLVRYIVQDVWFLCVDLRNLKNHMISGRSRLNNDSVSQFHMQFF